MVSAVGSSYNSYNQYFFDMETQELSKKNADGGLEKLTPSEKEQVLASAGLAVGPKGLVDTISGDTFDMQNSQELAARFSVGGKPEFADSHVNTTSLAPDVRAACELLENMNGSSTSLMLTQMMVLLKIAQQDKKSNDEMLLTADSMKLLSKDDEKAAKARSIEAEKDQAVTELVGALGGAAMRITASVLTLSKSGEAPKSEGTANDASVDTKNKKADAYKDFIRNIANGTSPLFKSYTNMFSYLSGAKKAGLEASIDEQNAQKNTEAISQLQTYIKEAQRDVQNSQKEALQLIKSVAERQVENIKAMTNA